MIVGPSSKRAAWRGFLGASAWDPADFARLVQADDIGAACFEVETYINGVYRSVQKAEGWSREWGLPLKPGVAEEMREKAQWLSANFEPFREALGPAQRELDLGLMRWMRRSSCLSAVVGAGATKDAGGPSWAELVQQLLLRVIERGRESWEMRPTPTSTPENMQLKRVVTGVEHLTPDTAARAREVLTLIADGKADTEALMRGAQLCHEFLGQHLFTDLTNILYRHERKPGAIHKAIAALAKSLEVRDRGGVYPGWDAIITYNFDDFMGEALDAAGLARAAYAMRGEAVVCDPNDLALAAGENGLHQSIYHLHGYTPRRPFLITHVRFVFSTSQYDWMYGNSRAGIVEEVFERWLANPVHHALYVGCSFQDDAMNTLLHDASHALPGRYHYALLKWPGKSPFVAAPAGEVALASARYLAIGVRPIWFDRFDEIPGLISQLG